MQFDQGIAGLDFLTEISSISVKTQNNVCNLSRKCRVLKDSVKVVDEQTGFDLSKLISFWLELGDSNVNIKDLNFEVMISEFSAEMINFQLTFENPEYVS